ncbi:HNH endonuclease [Candidatus Pacearchaeota archaeon]|jgi:hypothetical protein|nr:HNH endonuclease [Candidatus Pacearchaeota archaeon]
MKTSLREKFERVGYTVAENGCWTWKGRVHPNGYAAMSRHTKAHRASYEIFKGPIPEGLDVCHTCDNPLCVNPLYLFAATRKINMQDCVAKGRTSKGNKGRFCEKTAFAKLTNKQVKKILLEHKHCMGENTRLAKKYGVHHSTIHLIVKRKTWKQIYET